MTLLCEQHVNQISVVAEVIDVELLLNKLCTKILRFICENYLAFYSIKQLVRMTTFFVRNERNILRML